MGLRGEPPVRGHPGVFRFNELVVNNTDDNEGRCVRRLYCVVVSASHKPAEY